MKLTEISINFTRNGEYFAVSFDKSCEKEGVAFKVENGAERFALDLSTDSEIVIKGVRATFSYDFPSDCRIFLNGYQSWTSCREHTTVGRLHGIYRLPRALVDRFAFDKYGDYTFVTYGRRAGQLHGFTYGYIRTGKEFFFLGSTAERSGYTVIRTDARAKTVSFEKDCHDHAVSGGYKVFDVALISGGEDEVFDRYFALLGIPKCTAPRINGYTSWYNRYEDISEESISSDLAGFGSQKTLPDVFQIDDGYEAAVGDWLTVDPEKFPSGMKAASDKIRSAGMTPGLWLAPFAAEKESALVKDHPEWLLRDMEGKPVVGGSNWSGFYGLDIYNEEFRSYIREVFRTVIEDWGYRFLKLDFLYACSIVPRRDKTRAEVMYDGMDFIRELCGTVPVIGCGVPLAPAFGKVEYCRIGCDVSLSWDDVIYMRPMHSERPSTKKTVLNTIFRRQLDGRAFRCDPDVYLLRDENISLSLQEKKTLAVVNALFGGVLFTSDDPATYSDEAKKIYDTVMKLDRSALSEVVYENRVVTVKYFEDGREESVSVSLGVFRGN